MKVGCGKFVIMRKEELELLAQEYTESRRDFDRRFYDAIGADVPHAGKL